MRREIAVAMTSLIVFAGAGCSPFSVAKRGIAEVKGATSDSDPVPGTGSGSFARFGGVTIDQPQSDAGGLIPSEFKSQLVTNLQKALTQGKEPIFAGGAPTLTIEPHVMWYTKSNPLFPHKYAVVMYHLRGDGTDMGKVQVVTKSEATGTGHDDMAEANAKGLAKYFKKHGKAKAGDKEDKD